MGSSLAESNSSSSSNNNSNNNNNNSSSSNPLTLASDQLLHSEGVEAISEAQQGAVDSMGFHGDLQLCMECLSLGHLGRVEVVVSGEDEEVEVVADRAERVRYLITTKRIHNL